MRHQLIDDGRAGRMPNPGSWHVGAGSEPSLSQQSGTRGRTVRNTSNTPKQNNHAPTRKSTVSKSVSIHRRDDIDHHHHHSNSHDNNSRFAHTEASSSSRIRPSTGNDDGVSRNQAGPNQARIKTRLEPNIGSCPQPSRPYPGQSNTGSTPSRDALHVNARNNMVGDKKKKPLRSDMDRTPGFSGGPFTVSARSTRRPVQRETGGVPVPVPVNGTRLNPIGSTSTTSATIEVGKSKENGQANQVSRSSSLAIIERRGGVGDNINGSRQLHWKIQEEKEHGKDPVYCNLGTTKIDVDIGALNAEKQKKMATLKGMSFSKKVKQVKEEEVFASLRAGMGDADVDADGSGDSERRRKESDGGGESRQTTMGEMPVNGQVGGKMLEQVQSPSSRPWTWEGQGNIPGLSATSRSARIQPAGVVETRPVPIPLPSLYPGPPDSVSDISDEDLYSPKKVEKVGVDVAASQVHVKEEQRDDPGALFDSPIPWSFPDLQTPISAPTTIGLEQNATSELSIPAHVDNSASYPLDTVHPKNKRKQHNLSHAKNVRSSKKVKTDICALNAGEGQSESNRVVVRVRDEDEVPRTSMPKRGKKGKGKKTEKHVIIDKVEREVSLTGGEDEMEVCAVETKQGEIPTDDALSEVASGAVSTAGPSDSWTGIKETIESKEGERPENAEQECVKAGTEIFVTPSIGPLPASASVHDATDSAANSGTRGSSRRGRRNGQAAENAADSTNEVPRRKRKVRGQTTEAGEQTRNHDVNPVGGKEISHPGETPRKKRKVKEAGLAKDGEEAHPNETPKKDDQTTEGGERTQGGSTGDEHIPQAEGTPKKIKETDPTTEDGEIIQGSSAGSADITLPNETSKKKGKATDQSTTNGVQEPEKKKRGRPKAKKDDEDTKGETLLKVTEENGLVKEVKGKTRGKKKRATMDEKDGMTDGVVRKKRVKLAFDEVGDGNQQSGKTVKSTVKWMLVCKNRTATGRKASRQTKGKEKAQSVAMAHDVDLHEKFKEVTEGKTLRPSIWASSKAELLLVLPELSGSKCFNGIAEGSSNFPMVMLDESTAESICVDVRWFGGEESESSRESPSVRLTLARDFICPVGEGASTAGIPVDSLACTAPSDAGPSSDVMTQPNAPLSAAPGASVDGNGCGIDDPLLPMVLPHDDYHGMDLEYIDEDALQGGAVGTLCAPPVNMPPCAPPVLDVTTTAHISHKMYNFSQGPAGQQYPNTLSTPSTISIPSLQFQHPLPFTTPPVPIPIPTLHTPVQQYQIPFTTPPVPIPIPTLHTPVHDEKPSPPIPFELKSELDTIIPPSPPPEIEILISSWKLSLPLVLLSSHETFKRHFWGPLALPPHSNCRSKQAEKVGLAAEHAYVFLGFFRVVKMDERRVTLPDEDRVDLRPGKVAGRVEWTFDVEWVPGYHGSKGSEELSHPWWAPDFVLGRPVERERGSKKEFTWLEKHAQARLNLLPMQLVDGQEAGSSDEAMPKGWLCKACGKLNQKVMMRHRWCGSKMCRDNPLSRGYAVDLFSARDANQTPLALPINTCNRKTVDASVADWDDGMRTLKYRPMSIPGNAGERGGILQHVFTCNLVDLQTEATALFESIQSEVCLTKSTGDPGPLFKSHVSNSYAYKKDKFAFSCLSWSEAPQAVRDAKDLMTFMGKYGEEEALDIDHLTIIGWVSSGTRKTPMVLAAREHTIAMLCLGNDVVLTIVPKWEASVPIPLQVQQSSNLSYPPSVSPFAPDADMVNPAALPPSIPVLPHVESFTSPTIQSTLARTPRAIKPPSADQMPLVDVAAAPATENVRQAGAISENPPGGVVPAQITSRNSRSKPLKPKPKQASESMSVTLVHGDMLLFSGCDFEYSIKRMGTSILVIGSKEEGEEGV